MAAGPEREQRRDVEDPAADNSWPGDPAGAGVLGRPPGSLGAEILGPCGRVAAQKSGRCPPARSTLAGTRNP
ncbi:hypothetical protein NDU88_003697 [Pleurodeles waltl]|uniref:Uncharacterized protein n=1 Tax=Pleurodeles waltl TaxID=8319 RepID=A0AAV7QDN9_PLEWA|nr:hypothetical protein NDU88_003697 [Pleurodeles waltl]